MRPPFSQPWISLILLLICLPARADTLVSPPPPLPTNEWNVSTAPARFVVVPDQPGTSAPLASVPIALPNPNWALTTMRVFNNSGVAVASDLLWSAAGEPATVIFDSSSNAKYYYIYVGSNWPPMPLDAKAGVTLESRASDGKTIDHLPDMLQAWNQSTTINGRAIVPGIFEGGNRFGPQANSLQHFQGWFNVANAEHLQLAAISTDASFVLVDGNEVVEWPGRHDFHPGLGGQFQGAVDLAPGLHSLDYYNAYVSGNEGHPLLCCLAVKGGDIANWTMLTPDNALFLPSIHFHVNDYQLQTAPASTTAGDVPPVAIDWVSNGQSMIAPDVPDIGLISMQLTCRPATGTAHWTFDDGGTADGDTVYHLFLRPGMRTVQVDVTVAHQPFHFSQVINVHPNWIQLSTIPPQLMPPHQANIMARDPATITASDLASSFAVFEVFKNNDGLLKLLSTVCAKIKDIPEADLPYIKDAALYLAREDFAHSTEATQLLQALVDRCSQDKPSPELVAVGSASRLALAELTLRNTNQTDDVRKLLDGIDVTTLPGDEHRAYDTLRADLALATGDVAEAKKQYTALTGDPSGPDARSSIRRIAKVNQARSYIDNNDTESAERALAQVAHLAPGEKLSPDWALTRLKLYRLENQPVAAYLWARRLLPVLVDDGRSELLYQLTDLAFAQNDDDAAKKYLAELLKKHPYSPEAAQAKEKWPDKS
jgi:tetratricopeptide (TPR) repeat protein